MSFIPGWNFSPANQAEISDRLTRLKFQTGLWNKSSENQVVNYMERDSARGTIQPGLKNLAQYSQTGLGFSARSNGLKKEREHAYLLCFRTSVNFLTEIGVLHPGWNWACNRNNISGRWAERNFSPGWNSPCNQALSFQLWVTRLLWLSLLIREFIKNQLWLGKYYITNQ